MVRGSIVSGETRQAPDGLQRRCDLAKPNGLDQIIADAVLDSRPAFDQPPGAGAAHNRILFQHRTLTERAAVSVGRMARASVRE
jgi:hypothetical protein